MNTTATPIYSMTGYASAQHQSTSEAPTAAPAPRLGLEIRSVNSRFLDLVFRMPEELRAHEPALRALLAGRLKRGKVEVRLTIESEGAAALIPPSDAILRRMQHVQEVVQSHLPRAGGFSVNDALRIASHSAAAACDWAAVVPALAEQALTALLDARAREGAQLAAMLLQRIAQLQTLIEQATPLIPQLVQQQQQKFLDRFQEALGLARDANMVSLSHQLPQNQNQNPAEQNPSLSPTHNPTTIFTPIAYERALSEAAAFAIRIDVAEELSRLAAHLKEIERLIHKGGEIGKRLDFLIQELHREANTLGSKSAALELTKISVEMKVLIEQMREQVQNLE